MVKSNRRRTKVGVNEIAGQAHRFLSAKQLQGGRFAPAKFKEPRQ
jgi:hypothetical protein